MTVNAKPMSDLRILGASLLPEPTLRQSGKSKLRRTDSMRSAVGKKLPPHACSSEYVSNEMWLNS